MPSTPDRARRDRHDGAGPTTTLDIAALRGRVEPGDILLIRTGYNRGALAERPRNPSADGAPAAHVAL
jgi:hypothetical protein